MVTGYRVPLDLIFGLGGRWKCGGGATPKKIFVTKHSM